MDAKHDLDESNGHVRSLTITQIMGIKNVVLDATPEFYLIRSTYSAFSVKTDISMNGKSTPTPKTPDYGQSLVGASFTIKQAPDGRVLDVMGLEDLVARMQRSFATPNQTPQQRAQFARFLPSAKTLKETISKNQSAALPKTPLAVGQSFSYAVALPSSFPMNMTLSSKKTLLSFDVQSATFGDNGTFNTSATQPLVMGKTKTYTAMKGTISGQSVVDTETGLPRSSTTTTKITGKVTVVQAGQAPVSVPLALTSQATVVTTTP